MHPSDLEPLKELHRQLFPVDYDAEFFYRAVHGLDDIASWAAVAAAPRPPSPLQLPSLRDFAAAPLCPSSRGASAPPNAAPSYPAEPSGPPNPPSRLLAGAISGGDSSSGEQLAGFVTAKPFPLIQVEARDRQLLGFADPSFDQDRLSYILTLGVAEVRLLPPSLPPSLHQSRVWLAWVWSRRRGVEVHVSIKCVSVCEWEGRGGEVLAVLGYGCL